MFICPSCGATLADDSPDCPYCGMILNTRPAAQQPGYQQPGYQQPNYQQPNYQQPNYPQPNYQQPYNPNPVAPRTVPPADTGGLFAWAIITLLLCTIPGIVALVNVSKVKNCTTVTEQQQALSSARTWCLVGTILGILALIGAIAQASMS